MTVRVWSYHFAIAISEHGGAILRGYIGKVYYEIHSEIASPLIQKRFLRLQDIYVWDIRVICKGDETMSLVPNLQFSYTKSLKFS